MSSKRRPTKIDLSSLSWGTIRKYQYFYGLKQEHDRDMVLEAVRGHFEEELKAPQMDTVARFLRIKKDDKQDPNYNLRKPARVRGAGAAHLANDTLF